MLCNPLRRLLNVIFEKSNKKANVVSKSGDNPPAKDKGKPIHKAKESDPRKVREGIVAPNFPGQQPS